MEKIFKLKTEYINLTQLLKITNIVGSGSDAHYYIVNGMIKVNGKVDVRKRAKLFSGDIIEFEKNIIKIE